MFAPPPGQPRTPKFLVMLRAIHISGIALLLLAVGLNALAGQLLAALFGAGLVFAGAWQCWRRGWIGGGDVKLLAACALLVPPGAVPELLLATAIAGGVLAALYLVLGRLLPRERRAPGARSRRARGARSRRVPGVRFGRSVLIVRVWRAECRRIRRRVSLPYACAIAAGVLLTLASPIPFG